MKKNLPGLVNEADLAVSEFSSIGIMDKFFDSLAELKGEAFVPSDPSSPVVHLYEMAATLHVDTNRRMLKADKRHYAILGETEEELYAGMTGVDYLDRFATPSRVNDVVIRIPTEEIMIKAIEDPTRGTKKLIIGKDSTFTVNGMAISIHYPIEIRLSRSGVIQATWLTEPVSALQTIGNNQLVVHRFIPPGGDLEVVDIHVPAFQFKRQSNTHEINTSGFQHSVSFEDQFYHAEVFMDTGGGWERIPVTHSAVTYNPSQPTAVLKRVDQELKVWIPQVYFDRGLVGRALRIDVLTTKGAVNANLSDFNMGAWQVHWRDLDNQNDPYQLAFKSINLMGIYSNALLTGGSNQKTLEELKQRKIQNATVRQKPITDNELMGTAQDMGFSINLKSDGIGARIYQLSRTLPSTQDYFERDYHRLGVKGQVDSDLLTFRCDFSVLKALPNVAATNDKVTLSNQQGFLLGSGNQLTPIDMAAIQDSWGGNNDRKAEWLNANKLVYSPFFYTVDNSGPNLQVGVFDLDYPTTEKHRFIDDNANSPLAVSSSDITIEKTTSGYRFWLAVNGSALDDVAPKDLAFQIGLAPHRETAKVFARGDFHSIDGDYWRYTLDLDINHLLDLNETVTAFGLRRFVGDLGEYVIDLAGEMDILWVTTTDTPTSGLDSNIERWLFNDDFIALTLEKVQVQLGKRLMNVAGDYRRVIGDPTYAVNEEDVYLRWEEDIPLRDDNGNFVYEGVDGQRRIVWEHRAGDKVMVMGQPIIIGGKGSPKYEYGERVIESPGETSIIFDLVTIEGNWRWLTNPLAQDFYRESIRTMVGYVEQAAGELSQRSLPGTVTLFAPNSRLRPVLVTEANGVVVSIPAEESPSLRVYCNDTVFDDLELRQTLRDRIHEEVDLWLAQARLSTTELSQRIESLSPDIITVTVSKISGNFEVVTLKDPTQNLVMKKTVVVNGRGELDIQDTFSVEWIRH